MGAIGFTQYMRPNGRPVAVSIDRPEEISAKAAGIVALGFSFECEELMDGTVSLTISHEDRGDVAIELVPNGPDVPAAVDRLVNSFRAPKSRRTIA